jgi:hypothetical protein
MMTGRAYQFNCLMQMSNRKHRSVEGAIVLPPGEDFQAMVFHCYNTRRIKVLFTLFLADGSPISSKPIPVMHLEANPISPPIFYPAGSVIKIRAALEDGENIGRSRPLIAISLHGVLQSANAVKPNLRTKAEKSTKTK